MGKGCASCYIEVKYTSSSHSYCSLCLRQQVQGGGEKSRPETRSLWHVRSNQSRCGHEPKLTHRWSVILLEDMELFRQRDASRLRCISRRSRKSAAKPRCLL